MSFKPGKIEIKLKSTSVSEVAGVDPDLGCVDALVEQALLEDTKEEEVEKPVPAKEPVKEDTRPPVQNLSRRARWDVGPRGEKPPVQTVPPVQMAPPIQLAAPVVQMVPPVVNMVPPVTQMVPPVAPMVQPVPPPLPPVQSEQSQEKSPQSHWDGSADPISQSIDLTEMDIGSIELPEAAAADELETLGPTSEQQTADQLSPTKGGQPSSAQLKQQAGRRRPKTPPLSSNSIP